MSRNKSINKKQNTILSTNNKNFTSGGRIFSGNNEDDIIFNRTVTDEDIRLGRGKDRDKLKKLVSEYSSSVEKPENEILQDSRNGVRITNNSIYNVDDGITHYTALLRKYDLDHPEEWALCHYNLAKLYMVDSKDKEKRPKNIESSLFHFTAASQIFTATNFPTMWSLISLLQAFLHRERTSLMLSRDYIHPSRLKLTIAQSISLGIQSAEEALHVFSVPTIEGKQNGYALEHGMSRMLLGWLLLQQFENDVEVLSSEVDKISNLDRCITMFERALPLLQKLDLNVLTPKKKEAKEESDDINEITKGPAPLPTLTNNKKRGGLNSSHLPVEKSVISSQKSTSTLMSDTNSNQFSTHHPSILLSKLSPMYSVGIVLSLVGRAYFHLGNEGPPEEKKDNYTCAYQYLCESILPKYLLKIQDDIHFVQSHYLLSHIAIAEPSVVNDSEMKSSSLSDANQGFNPAKAPGCFLDFLASGRMNMAVPTANTEMAIEISLLHLNSCLSAFTSTVLLAEIHFLAGQIQFMKLNFCSDKVITVNSLVESLPDGSIPAEVMIEASDHYHLVLRRVVGNSTIRIDSFLYFMSCLKLAELRVLQAIAIKGVINENADVETRVNSNENGEIAQNSSKNKMDQRSIDNMNEDKEFLTAAGIKLLLICLQVKNPYENSDLHFLSSSHLGVLLSLTSKSELAMHGLIRSFLTLSLLCLRSKYLFFISSGKSLENLQKKEVSQTGKQAKKGKQVKDVVISTPSKISFYNRQHRTFAQLAQDSSRTLSMIHLSNIRLVEWEEKMHRQEGVDYSDTSSSWVYEVNTNRPVRVEKQEVKELSSKLVKDDLDVPINPISNWEDCALKPNANSNTNNSISNQNRRSLDQSQANLNRPSSAQGKATIPIDSTAESDSVPATAQYRYFVPKNNVPSSINVNDIPLAPKTIKAPSFIQRAKSRNYDALDDAEVKDSVTNMNLAKAIKDKRVDENDAASFHNIPSKVAVQSIPLTAKLMGMFYKYQNDRRKKIERQAILNDEDFVQDDRANNVINFKSVISSVVDSGNQNMIRLIATENCRFTLVMLSYAYRQQLFLKCNYLRVHRSARLKQLLSSHLIPSSVLESLRKIQGDVLELCNGIVPCPTTIGDLGNVNSYHDIRNIFKSQIKVNELLKLEDEIVCKELSKMDLFLPYVLTLPSYTNIDYDINVGKDLSIPGDEITEIDGDPLVMPTRNDEKLRQKRMYDKYRRGLILQGKGFGETEVKGEEYSKKDFIQNLDATIQGMNSMLSQNIQSKEAILQFHLFNSSHTAIGTTQTSLQVILIWKEVVEEKLFQEDNELPPLKKKTNANKSSSEMIGETVKKEKMFSEFALCNVVLAQLVYGIQSFVDAIHSRPPPIRSNKCSEAIKYLSNCLSLSALLAKLPDNIESIAICCPSYLNLVPWSLLLIDDKVIKDSNVGNMSQSSAKIHLMDKYVVRVAQSLPMCELNEYKSSRLNHKPGQHKLCYINGDDDNESSVMFYKAECIIATQLWSSDPWDYTILSGKRASAKSLKINVNKRNDNMASTMKDIMKHNIAPVASKLREFGEVLKDEVFTLAEAYYPLQEDADEVQDHNKHDIEAIDSNQNSKSSKVKMKRVSVVENEEEEKYTPPTVTDINKNSSILINCRVLHLCSVIDDHGDIAFKLPKGYDDELPHKRLNAINIVNQIYFKNCALAVVSRIGILDRMSPRKAALHSNNIEIGDHVSDMYEIIDALQLAGCSSVVCPMWGGGALGGDIGQLARILLISRFYYELPLHANQTRPVAIAVQKSQQWLRDSTMFEIAAFVDEMQISEEAQLEVKMEINALEHSNHHKLKGTAMVSYWDSKLFSHFYYWGMLVAIGDCRSVHPSIVGEEEKVSPTKSKSSFPVKGREPLTGGGDGDGDEGEEDLTEDERLELLIKEMKWLKMEGKDAEADLINKKIWKIRSQKLEGVKQKIDTAKEIAVSTSKTVARRTSVVLENGIKKADQYKKKYEARRESQSNEKKDGRTDATNEEKSTVKKAVDGNDSKICMIM